MIESIFATLFGIGCAIFLAACAVALILDHSPSRKEEKRLHEEILDLRHKIKNLESEKEWLTREKDHLSSETETQKRVINELQKEIASAKRRGEIPPPAPEGEINLVTVKRALGPNFRIFKIYEAIRNQHLYNALDPTNSKLSILNLKINAVIKSESSKGTNRYEVNFNEMTCTCPDFKTRAATRGYPCKHVLFVAHQIGLLQSSADYRYKHFEKLIKHKDDSLT